LAIDVSSPLHEQQTPRYQRSLLGASPDRTVTRMATPRQRSTHRVLCIKSQLQNSFTQLRSGRSQDVVHRDSMGTDALHQGLATGAIGCIPTECQVMGYHLFYRAMHPYGMRGFAIRSQPTTTAASISFTT